MAVKHTEAHQVNFKPAFNACNIVMLCIRDFAWSSCT